MDSFAFQSFLLVRSCAEHDFSESVVVSNFFCHYSLCCLTVYALHGMTKVIQKNAKMLTVKKVFTAMIKYLCTCTVKYTPAITHRFQPQILKDIYSICGVKYKS